MVYDYFDKYTFTCEMYEEEADKIRNLILNFYPFDNSVEVFDTMKGTKLVRRVRIPSLTREMLQIGNVINIFSKLLRLTDCTIRTRETIFPHFQSTFALIKPLPPKLLGKIVTYIIKKGFRIIRMKNGILSKNDTMKLYAHFGSSHLLPLILEYTTSGVVVGLELVASDAIKKWRHCLGATNPEEAAPGTVRKLFGLNIVKNAAHGTTSVETTQEMLEMFFGHENGIPRVAYRATFKNCTCCVIKPHAILDGNLGVILDMINNNDFYITSIGMFLVSLTNSQEFFEVYKGVVADYEDMCIHLAEGRCVALEVKSKSESKNVVCEFRKLCGPRDPEMARQLYPDTIRAVYGKDIVHNAVHCTDLPEDAELEVEYFFKLLTIEE